MCSSFRRQQVDMPAHCSSNNLLLIKERCSCNALRLLRRLSYYLQFLLIPHGSFCVLHLTSFIRSSFVSLHHVHCHAFCFTSGILPLTTNPLRQDAQSLCKSGCHTELGEVHLVPLHSFVRSFIQSGSVHPLPMFLVLAGRPSPALRGILAQPILMQACHISPLHCASITP